MSNKQQTAVEWLYDTIDNALIDFLDSQIDLNELSVAMLKAKKQAKEIEKEQIIDAASDHCYPTCELARIDAEKYYNETYGE